LRRENPPGRGEIARIDDDLTRSGRIAALPHARASVAQTLETPYSLVAEQRAEQLRLAFRRNDLHDRELGHEHVFFR
jgi:hypothetical protein